MCPLTSNVSHRIWSVSPLNFNGENPTCFLWVGWLLGHNAVLRSLSGESDCITHPPDILVAASGSPRNKEWKPSVYQLTIILFVALLLHARLHPSIQPWRAGLLCRPSTFSLWRPAQLALETLWAAREPSPKTFQHTRLLTVSWCTYSLFNHDHQTWTELDAEDAGMDVWQHL